MDEDEVWRMLERGGAVRYGHLALDAAHHSDRLLGRYRALEHPSDTERLCAALLALLGPLDVDFVAVLDEIDDIVLGFIAAREAGRHVVRVGNVEGIVTPSSPIAPGSRALVIGDAFLDAAPFHGLTALLQARAATVVGVGTLADAGLVAWPEQVSLVSAVPYRTPVQDCALCARQVPLERAFHAP
ncbi:MAG: hypothetical protein HY691_19450 [Chloroflexi bacterium]|nr:hypothetical protein [Chloroflexota bacterium]